MIWKRIIIRRKLHQASRCRDLESPSPLNNAASEEERDLWRWDRVRAHRECETPTTENTRRGCYSAVRGNLTWASKEAPQQKGERGVGREWSGLQLPIWHTGHKHGCRKQASKDIDLHKVEERLRVDADKKLMVYKRKLQRCLWFYLRW